MNHLEQCGAFYQTDLPMKWMRNMMCRELKALGGECAPHPDSFSFVAAPEQDIPTGGNCMPLVHNCKGASLGSVTGLSIFGGGSDCCLIGDTFQCQPKLPDFIGVNQCPDKCKGKWGSDSAGYGSTAATWTCEDADRWHWPRSEGEPCLLPTDCDGWANDKHMGCCDWKCVRLKKDWFGAYWCPRDCKNGFFAPPGSC